MTDSLLRALLWVYRIGILIAIIIAVSGGPYLEKLGINLPNYSNKLFYFGVGHMLLLSILGYWAARRDRVITGTKIQTAGYLHTLIGFAAALILLIPDQERTLNSVLSPLGSAVVTSIIGWFVGGEIIEKQPEKRGGFLDYEMESIAEELNGFAISISVVHKEYIAALKETVSQLERETETLKKAKTISSEIGGLLTPFSASVASLLKNLREIDSMLLEAKKGLSETTTAAKDVAKYLNESRVLIEQLEGLLEFVSRSRRV